MLRLDELTDFIASVHSDQPVSGVTHNYYRYPARFSPMFVRSAISAFSEPGDLILDPFMGSGTTLVEAAIQGRCAIGTDISSLAVFLAQVKTSVYSDEDLRELQNWANLTVNKMNVHATPVRPTEWVTLGYQRNINCKQTWRLRKLIELMLHDIDCLEIQKQRFARCVVLRTAQWALDCRTNLPNVNQFRNQFTLFAAEMLSAARDYSQAISNCPHRKPDQTPVTCLNRSVVGIETEHHLFSRSPKLIVTSPPYPGVHVLYHRWQIQGRKETPAPFWIADCKDGNGASFYTLGDRKRPRLASYFQQARAAFTSLAKVSDENTLLIQMIAFSDPTWQLELYLDMMEDAGFTEDKITPQSGEFSDQRLWRFVPNRKWYTHREGAEATSKEVVLFHRLR